MSLDDGIVASGAASRLDVAGSAVSARATSSARAAAVSDGTVFAFRVSYIAKSPTAGASQIFCAAAFISSIYTPVGREGSSDAAAFARSD